MKPSWLPNWRNVSEYPDARTTSRSSFAWEFLRRNPNYQHDWKWFHSLQLPDPDYGVAYDDDSMHLCWCNPPARKGETFGEYRRRVDRYELAPWMSALARKYGLWHLYDPSDSSVGDVFYTRVLPAYLVNIGEGEYAAMRAENTGEAIAKFNLSWPIDFQIQLIKGLLTAAQSQLAKMGRLEVHKPRTHVTLFPAYLRLLDADLEQPVESNIREVADTVFPEKTNRYPEFSRDKAVRNGIKTARRLRDRDYLYIALPLHRKKGL